MKNSPEIKWGQRNLKRKGWYLGTALFLASSFSAFSSEAVLMNDVLIRIGHDPMPIILKDEYDCILKGGIKSNTLKTNIVEIHDRTCIVGGKKITDRINVNTIIKSDVIKNKITGELVNSIPSSTVIIWGYVE